MSCHAVGVREHLAATCLVTGVVSLGHPGRERLLASSTLKLLFFPFS